MDTIDDTKSLRAEHLAPEVVGEELVTVAGDAFRLAEVGVVVFLGLLVCPPLLILAVMVAVPLIAVAAVVAAVVGAVAVPTLLVRHVRAHHRAHGTTLFLHRPRRGADLRSAGSA